MTQLTPSPTRHVAALPPAVELVEVGKVFGATVACRDVSLHVLPGEVLALVGENGAGKSTCVKMLAGLYRPDAGLIRLGGREIELADARSAREAGIAVVHQHPELFDDLSITENVFAGDPVTSRGLVDWPAMHARAARLLAGLGLEVRPELPLRRLRVSEKQLVEIARALASDCSVLVLDEPTAALTDAEVLRLFDVVRAVCERGVAVVFVGHRLEEILALSDRVTVLRDGALVGTRTTASTTEDELVRLMVGRPLGELYARDRRPVGEEVLRLEGLSRHGAYADVDLVVRAGEIVGLAGLVGSGRTELARTVFGVDHADAGRIVLEGEQRQWRSPADAMAAGVAYVSEDRRGQSLVEEFSILDNAALPVIERASRAGLVRPDRAVDLVRGPLERMRLKFDRLTQPAAALSGGNQQKVVLAKWLATQPRLLILDEPTQGVDIGAKSEVHRIIDELAADGMAILLISSDLPEVVGSCDRVYVMNRGRLAAELTGDEVDQVAIGRAATGSRSLTAAGTAPTSAPATSPDASPDASPAPTPATTSRTRSRTTPAATPGAARRTAPPPSPAAGTAPTVATGTGSGGGVRRLGPLLANRPEIALAAALLLLIVPLSLLNPQFYGGENLRDLADYSSIVALVCLGEMLVILTRNIDLSVASTLGLSAYCAALTMREVDNAPVLAGVAVGLAVGAACGALNGVLVAYARIPSIVVTLATLALFRGILSQISSGDRIKPLDVPEGWLTWSKSGVGPLSTPMLVALVVFGVAGLLLARTRGGRGFYLTGSNPAGARLIGLRGDRRVLLAFTASGTLAGLAGTTWASYYPYVDGQVAVGLGAAVIASVVVGGVALRGGAGTVLGVAIGVVGLLSLRKVLVVAGVPDQYLQAVYGASILVAVTVDVVLDRRRAARSVAAIDPAPPDPPGSATPPSPRATTTPTTTSPATAPGRTATRGGTR